MCNAANWNTLCVYVNGIKDFTNNHLGEKKISAYFVCSYCGVNQIPHIDYKQIENAPALWKTPVHKYTRYRIRYRTLCVTRKRLLFLTFAQNFLTNLFGKCINCFQRHFCLNGLILRVSAQSYFFLMYYCFMPQEILFLSPF